MKRLLTLAFVLVALVAAGGAQAKSTTASACSDTGFVNRSMAAMTPALSSLDYMDAQMWGMADQRLVASERAVLRAPRPCRAVLVNTRALLLGALHDFRLGVVAGRRGNFNLMSQYLTRGTARLKDGSNRLKAATS